MEAEGDGARDLRRLRHAAYAEPSDASLRSVTAYLLPPGVFRPAFHMQCQHALLPVVDELPHYKGFPALFGGSDEQVDW